MNPFDWAGPTFLWVFVLAYGAAAALQRIATLLAVKPTQSAASYEETAALGHYEVAYLSGGPRAAADAAVAVLLRQGLLAYDRSQLVVTAANARSVLISPGVYREVAVPSDQHPLERALLRSVASKGRMSLRELRASVLTSTRPLAELLEQRRMIIAPGPRALGFLFAVVPLFLLLLAGAIKVAIGISREKSVAALVVLLIGVGLYIVLGARWRFPRRTAKGDAALERLRLHNSALRTTAVSAPQQLHAYDAALGFALFGSAVLGAANAELSADIQRFGSGIDAELRGSWLESWFSGWNSGSRGSNSGSGGSSTSGSGCGGARCGGSSCGGGCGGGCGGCGG
jgi:uncharacterized protein (TIGR04222 family)